MMLPAETFVFDHSFILGWRHNANELQLFVEVRVLPRNPHFRPFDKTKEVGCYVVGTITFRGVSDVVGLPTENHPFRRGALDEFEDVAEIEVFQSDAGNVRIEADALQLGWGFATVVFEPGIQG